MERKDRHADDWFDVFGHLPRVVQLWIKGQESFIAARVIKLEVSRVHAQALYQAHVENQSQFSELAQQESRGRDR